MSQATQPAPAPTGAAAPAPATAVVAADPAAAPSRFTEDVPQLLNRLQALAVGACVVFAVVSALLQLLSWQASGRAADNTEQVVRVQEIQSSLLRADALATNAFLVGGLEPAETREAYDAAIDDVLTLTTDAADAQPADRDVLADLNIAVRTYTTAVTQARDNNRQGFPVATAYLNSAGASLRADALPIVKALVDTNAARATDEMKGQHPYWLFGVGALAAVLLWFVNRTIAKRFHRRLNVGVAVAGGIVVVVTLVTAVHASGRNTDNEETRDGSYRTAVDEAQARTAANDAKSQESQGLINRGSGPAYEGLWDDSAATVEDTASARTLRLWESYVDQHRAVRELDDAGEWDKAVALATSTEPTGPTALLDEVDHAAEQTVTQAADDATAAFRSGGFASLALIVITLLAGLVAAAVATGGINQRRREYS